MRQISIRAALLEHISDTTQRVCSVRKSFPCPRLYNHQCKPYSSSLALLPL